MKIHVNRLSVSRRTAATGILLGAILVAAGTTDAFGAARGTSFTPCLAGTGATAHFAGGLSGSPPAPNISTVSISGLTGADCNGSTVVAVLEGNPAGDPSADPTETLATYNSKLDPCSQQPLTTPNVVAAGSITLSGCATGGVAGVITNIHDLTRVALSVGGQNLPVTVEGETFTKSGAAPITSAKPASVLGTTAELPFTGSWAALTFWIGILFLLGGLVFILLARTRRHSEDAAPQG